MATLEQNIKQAISDFDGIKAAIEESGVEVPYGTDTKDYPEKIAKIKDKAYENGYAEGQASAERDIDPAWTNWSYLCSRRNSLANKLRYSDTSNGTNFSYMFYFCSALTSVPALDTSKGTDFNSMFYFCSALTSVPALDTSKGTNFGYMFFNCSALTSVPALDTSKGTNFNSMFYKATSLENLTIEGEIKKTGLSVQYCNNLTHESLMSIINALYDYSGTTGTYTVTLGGTNKAKLTSDELAIASNKGWTVV